MNQKYILGKVIKSWFLEMINETSPEQLIHLFKDKRRWNDNLQDIGHQNEGQWLLRSGKLMTKPMRASSFLILGVRSWVQRRNCFPLRIQSWGAKHANQLEFAQQSTEPTELHRAPRIRCEETIQGQKRDISNASKFTKWQK